jgi:hypothetical protein
MRTKVACLLLALALLGARAQYLLAGGPATVRPADRPECAGKFFPISVRFRAEIQQRLEPPPVPALPPAEAAALDLPGPAPSTFVEPAPPARSGAERRHLLASLQL